MHAQSTHKAHTGRQLGKNNTFFHEISFWHKSFVNMRNSEKVRAAEVWGQGREPEGLTEVG